MNVVICDDNMTCRQAVSRIVDHWATISQLSAALMRYDFASTEDLLKAWENGLEIDMLFLDIQIPGEMSGLELARIIRRSDMRASIAFITNYSEFACEGYSVNALRYLRKPIVESEIFECLDIAYRQWRDTQISSIFIDTQRKKIIVPCKQLVYIEAQGHYLYLNLTEGTPKQIRSNIATLAEKLPPQMFVQCHRSYIVNLLYVRNLTKTTLTLADNTHISIGSRYVESVFSAVRLFYQGGVSHDLGKFRDCN